MTTTEAGPTTGTPSLCPAFDHQELRCVARAIARRTRSSHLLPDLLQCAAVGMLEAQHSFDPTRGVPFGAYARHRIRGAVYDGLCELLPARRCAAVRMDGAALQTARRNRYDDLIEDQAPAATAQELLEEQELLHRLRAAFQGLAGRDQEVLAAVYDLSGQRTSGARVALERGCSRSTVSREHLRALTRLRRKLIRGPGHE